LAIKDLSDEQYGRISRAINEYTFYDVLPELIGIENTVFILVKPTLDSSIKARVSGARGGAPQGNQNAAKQAPLFSKNNHPCLPKTSKVEVDGNVNGKVDGDGDVDNKTPQAAELPPLLNFIKSKTHELGFFLDDSAISMIARSGIAAEWFTDKHSILDLAAQKARSGEYAHKPPDEQKRIFISALTKLDKWQDFIGEYPAWREKQQAHTAKATAQEKRDNPPDTCEKCSGHLYGRGGCLVCENCGAMYDFDIEKKDWVFTEFIAGSGGAHDT
jgi:hypothetical protein